MDSSEVIEGGPDEIRPVHREEFADRGILHDFAEWASYLFPGKGDDYMDNLMLEEQDWSTGYWNIQVVSEGAQENISTCADPKVDNLQEGVPDDEDKDFNGAIRG